MKITIFTPTYNRKNKLKRVYDSLCAQKCYNFEWLIIDDGSSDNTEELIFNYINNGMFPVRYFKKNNGGKHTAYNMALELAKGDFFMCLDSDDYLTNGAISIITSYMAPCSKEGIIAYKCDELGNRLGSELPEDVCIASTLELEMKYSCTGEYTLIYPTSVAREFPFPVFTNERFITECVIYDRISRVCSMQLLKQVITICEYQTDGYTNNLNALMQNNPAGYCLYYMQRIDIQKNWKKRLVYAGKYHCFGLFTKGKKICYEGRYQSFVTCVTPMGIIFWIYYKLFRQF